MASHIIYAPTVNSYEPAFNYRKNEKRNFMNNDYVSLVLNDLLSRTRYSKLKLNTYHLNEIKKK